MRILYLITSLGYGGAETQLVQLATRVMQRGHEVQTITMTRPRAYVEELERAGIAVYTLDMRKGVSDLRGALKLAEMLWKWRPHVLHSHMVHANLLARVIRLLVWTPVLVCTAHNVDERGHRGGPGLRELGYRLTDPLCDLTTQVSQAGLERYLRVRAVRPHKVRHIPNGIDAARFRRDSAVRARVRAELDLGDSFVWLAVGRFEAQKDYPTMLRAFALVRRSRPGTILLIAGGGALLEEARKLAIELDCRESVRFLGVRRDVPDLMSGADAFVLSSAWEGFGLVIAEAMASELPVVATDSGGPREILDEGRLGFLVPPCDPAGLAQAMLRVMNLPAEERRRMGEAARTHVEVNYSLDRVVDQWEALYVELLDRSGGRPRRTAR